MGAIDSAVSKWFSKDRADGADACDLPSQEMEAELARRKVENVFPLDVFHPQARSFMRLLHTHMDAPRSFLGLNMLAAYSSAIGTAYGIERSGKVGYMCIWGCMYGMTSSGKSMVFDLIYEPLNRLQDEFDREFFRQEKESPVEGEFSEPPTMKTVVYRESHLATLMRTVMPANPKGVTKMQDEILEWVNGFNQQGNRESTDEQFWLSAWNASRYTAIRAGGKKFVTPKVFVNVMGGVQEGIAWKLFKNDRAVTGFIFRILFAVLEESRIALPDSTFRIPEQDMQKHIVAIQRMFKELPVRDGYDDPKLLVPSERASKMHDEWKRRKAVEINRMDDVMHREVHAGILGKMGEYALRFAGLLCVADMAYDNHGFRDRAELTEDHMERGIRLADYFYDAAWHVYGSVNKAVYAPMDVLRWASYVRSGMTLEKIGGMEFPTLKSKEAQRKKAGRELKKMIQEYPRVFGAVAKS